MTLATTDGELTFNTIAGRMSMAELAKTIRVQSGYESIYSFERGMGIDHPRWYHMERGKFKSPRLLLQVLCDLGYEITINKGAKQ